MLSGFCFALFQNLLNSRRLDKPTNFHCQPHDCFWILSFDDLGLFQNKIQVMPCFFCVKLHGVLKIKSKVFDGHAMGEHISFPPKVKVDDEAGPGKNVIEQSQEKR